MLLDKRLRYVQVAPAAMVHYLSQFIVRDTRILRIKQSQEDGECPVPGDLSGCRGGKFYDVCPEWLKNGFRYIVCSYVLVKMIHILML